MNRNFHAAPFDDATKVKLRLYRLYLREWLPVFLARKTPFRQVVNIFDFFSGPGRDSTGEPGSPLIAVQEVFKHRGLILSGGFKVRLYLNELDKAKFQQLSETLSSEKSNSHLEIVFSNRDFQEAFELWHPLMDEAANLLFLDQQGIKQVTDSVFRRVATTPVTDFLFFIASSFFLRFWDHESFRNYIKIPREEIHKVKPSGIHRVVVDYYRSLAPEKTPYYLAQFSIKKGSNFYGLVFGSGHSLGIEKFLITAWNLDKERGEANFDIDDDRITPGQGHLFPEMARPKKTRGFEADLRSRIGSGDLATNHQIFRHTLSKGFLPRHAREIIAKLMREGKVSRRRFPVSREAMKREPVTVSLLRTDVSSGESDERLNSH